MGGAGGGQRGGGGAKAAAERGGRKGGRATCLLQLHPGLFRSVPCLSARQGVLGWGLGVREGARAMVRAMARERGGWVGRGLGVRIWVVGVELGGGRGGLLRPKATVRALGPGKGAGVDGAIYCVSRLGGDRIDLGLLNLVALPREGGRDRARVRCASTSAGAGARVGVGASVSAEVGSGGWTLGSVNAARKQRKNSPVVPRRRLASASAHLKVAVVFVCSTPFLRYYFLRLVRATRVRVSLPLTQLELQP